MHRLQQTDHIPKMSKRNQDVTISNAIWAFSDTMMQGKLKVVGHLHRNVKEKHYFHMGGLKSPKFRMVSPHAVLFCMAVQGLESLQWKIDFLSPMVWRHFSSKCILPPKKGENTINLLWTLGYVIFKFGPHHLRPSPPFCILHPLNKIKPALLKLTMSKKSLEPPLSLSRAYDHLLLQWSCRFLSLDRQAWGRDLPYMGSAMSGNCFLKIDFLTVCQ